MMEIFVVCALLAYPAVIAYRGFMEGLSDNLQKPDKTMEGSGVVEEIDIETEAGAAEPEESTCDVEPVERSIGLEELVGRDRC